MIYVRAGSLEPVAWHILYLARSFACLLINTITKRKKNTNVMKF
jgi:hypothetical protein